MNSIFKKSLSFCLLALGGIVFSGCSDDDIPDPVDTEKGSITAVVNSVDWESTNENFKLGGRTIADGAGAFVGTGDTLTIIGVQVRGADTTAIMLSVKLRDDEVGSYRLKSGAGGDGKAYFLPGISGNAIMEAKEKYDAGITHGELRITEYDPLNRKVSGEFGFSTSATGETTYTVIAGKVDNVTF